MLSGIKDVYKIEDNVKITYNVLFEMIICLNLLSNPTGNYHLQWAQAIRKKMPPKMLKELIFWGSFENFIFAMDLITVNGLLQYKKPEKFFKALFDLPLKALIEALWNLEGTSLEDNEEAYRKFSTRNENYQKVYQDPPTYFEHFKNFLQDFYYSFFVDLIPELELALIQGVNAKLTIYAQAGFEKLFNSLGRKISCQGGKLQIRGWRGQELVAGRDVTEIILMPTIFHAPHLLADETSLAKKVLIAFPLFYSPFLKGNSLSDEDVAYFAGIFRALGDPTRLKILLLIENGIQYNQDLVAMLQISQAAVSKQLTRLRVFNLIEGEEQKGNRVKYHVANNDIIATLRRLGVLSDKDTPDVKLQLEKWGR